MKTTGRVCFILFLFLLLGCSLVLDLWRAISLRPAFYLFALGVPVFAILPFWRSLADKCILVSLCAYVCVISALPFISLSPVKPFTRFYSSIENGMTLEQIDVLLEDRFPSGGRYHQPVKGVRDDGSIYFNLDPGKASYNAELVVVTMVDGKSVSKEYLPD
jgi:hypothetical protein